MSAKALIIISLLYNLSNFIFSYFYRLFHPIHKHLWLFNFYNETAAHKIPNAISSIWYFVRPESSSRLGDKKFISLLSSLCPLRYSLTTLNILQTAHLSLIYFHRHLFGWIFLRVFCVRCPLITWGLLWDFSRSLIPQPLRVSMPTSESC